MAHLGSNGCRTLVTSCAAAAVVACLGASPPQRVKEALFHSDPQQPEELGQVAWSRNLEAAEAEAARTGKPLLVLFSEVPGCRTCKSFGGGPLSNPLVVEAAETLFVPVAVYNNVPGADEVALKSFGESAWNNPVMRIVGAGRTDLAPKLTDEWNVDGITRLMAASLKAAGKDVPAWLAIVREEAGAKRTETAVFAMHCFWEGQATIGAMPGVIGAKVGMLDGREVVEATFDRDATSFQQVLTAARESGCASRVYPRDPTQAQVAEAASPNSVAPPTKQAVRESANDDLYQMRHSVWRAVPMTRLQALRVNAAIAKGADAGSLLSPRQLAFGSAVKDRPLESLPIVAGDADVATAWRKAQAAFDKPPASR